MLTTWFIISKLETWKCWLASSFSPSCFQLWNVIVIWVSLSFYLYWYWSLLLAVFCLFSSIYFEVCFHSRVVSLQELPAKYLVQLYWCTSWIVDFLRKERLAHNRFMFWKYKCILLDNYFNQLLFTSVAIFLSHFIISAFSHLCDLYFLCSGRHSLFITSLGRTWLF